MDERGLPHNVYDNFSIHDNVTLYGLDATEIEIEEKTPEEILEIRKQLQEIRAQLKHEFPDEL